MTINKEVWEPLPAEGSSMLEYALYYARNGIPVFPVKPHTKTGFYYYPQFLGAPSQKYPKGNPNSWKAQASTDPERIKLFWSDHPDANIGGCTGSGLYVLDLDREHVNKDGSGNESLISDGWERYRQWCRDSGLKLNTDTAMSLTGRGGNQLFYLADLADDIQGNSDIFGDNSGCDTRGQGNYVMLPPSIHPNGNRYEWEQSPDEYPILRADDAFFQFWKGSSSGKSPAGKKDPPFNPAQKVTSSRHDYLKRYVGWMLKEFPNMKQSQYEDMLRKKNEEDIVPPLGRNMDDYPDELERTMFPMIPKMMIKDRDKQKASEEQAKQYDTVTRTEEYWDGLINSGPEIILPKENQSVILPRADPDAEQTQFSIISWNDIEEKDLKWVWYPRIPAGKITIIQGQPGAGKTMFVDQLIADLTTGHPFVGEPDNMTLEGEERQPMNVLYQIVEDDAADTIKPRLKKAGADMKRVFSIDESESPLTFTDPRILQAVTQLGIKVCVFDPLVSYLGPGVDMSQANEVRAIMQKVVNMAKETGCAVVIVAHTNKMSSEKSAMNRLSGSVDFLASVRSMLTLGADPNDRDIKALALTKNNLTRDASTILFRITLDEPEKGLIEFVDYSDLTSDDILQIPRKNRSSPKVEEAVEFLTSALRGKGYEKVSVLKGMWERRKLSEKTVYRAKTIMGVRSQRVGGIAEKGFSVWALPDTVIPDTL